MRDFKFSLRYFISAALVLFGTVTSLLSIDAIRGTIPFPFIVLTLCAAIWLLFDRVITRRIAALADAADRQTNGALDARTDLYGSDELARLSRAFNEMADVIQIDIESLRKSEERFELAMRGANDGLWERDLVTNDVYFSPRWKNMIGYEDHEFPNDFSEWKKRVHPEDLEMVMDAMALHLDGHIPHYKIEYRLQHLDGSYRWILSRGLAVRDGSGRPVRIAGSHTDITDRKRSEEENLKFQAQMLQAQKLESLGVLAGGIAHDFNNLLMSIRGNAELALLNMSEASPTHKMIARITDIVQRAAELTKQMLAYSGKGRFVIEDIDVSDLVNNMTELLRVSVKKNVMMECRLARDLSPVLGDATQIRQVAMNLIINASDAIGDRSGQVTISTGVIECDKSCMETAEIGKELPEGRYVYISVEDNGCGMDEETKSRIFDPFFTTKFTGRGLGLAAVLGIVRGHKGALKVKSEVGKGTVFTVLLPESRRGEETKPGLPVGRTKTQGSGTVLVIDDEEEIIEVTTKMLELCGFSVLTATNGAKGIQAFLEHSEKISAALIDLTMPDMNGEETFREIKKIRSDVKVILTSGYSNDELSSRYQENGFAGFLQKPYTLIDLTDKIHDVIAG